MLFKTLTRKINIDLADTVYKNVTFKKYKFNFIESFIVNNSNKPIINSIKYLLFFTIIVLLLYILLEIIYGIPKDQFPTEEWKSISNVNDTILTSQLTILALIFPLIVGYVGILFKDDIANKSLWRIYGRYSGFLLVGYSGLFLISSILLLKLFTPFIVSSSTLGIVVSLTFIFWFIFNIFLLGWMIHATFDFIKIETQNEVIIKYAVNIVIVMEIRKRLFNLIPYHAINLKLLPSKSKNLDIEFFILDADFRDSVQRKFTKEMYLKDINFTLLTWMINSILLRINYFFIQADKQIILPTTGSGYPSKTYSLASLRELEFTLLEKLLIKAAYRFSNKNVFRDDDVNNIVNSFFNNIDNSIKQDNQRVFENAVENLQNFMQTIFSTTSFINENNELDNWLLLSDNSYFSQRLLHELLSEFYALNVSIINKSNQSNIYFRKFCYFYQYAFQENELSMHSTIIESLMSAHYNLWYQLVNDPQMKIQPFFNDLCIEFIGGWESWSNRRYRKILDWSTLARAKENLFNHLILTAKMIIEPLKSSNINASIWAINMLNNWYENYFGLNNLGHYFSWKTNILVSGIICEKCQYDDLFKYITNNETIDDLDDVCDIALQNTWKHTKIITAAYLLDEALKDPESHIRLVFALINGHRMTPDKSIPHALPTGLSSSDFLETYIQSTYPLIHLTKNKLVHSLLKSFNSIYEEKRISGRVYSGLGGENISNLRDCFIAFLIAMSDRKFDLSDDLYDYIFSDIFPVDNRDSLIRELSLFKEVDDDTLSMVKLLNVDGDTEIILQNYHKSIEQIIQKITDKNNQGITSEPISESRKEQLMAYCSKSAFTKYPKQSPMSLFRDVTYSEELDEEYHKGINLSGIGKRDLIENYNQRSVNEDSYYDNLVSNQVENHIYREMFSFINDNDLTSLSSTFDNETMLIVSMLKESSDNSMIFVGSQKIMSFLHRARWDRNMTLPFHIDFEKSEDNNYICTINSLPVYSITKFDINYCLLIDKTFFKSLTFQQYNENIFVVIDYIENTDDLHNGILHITYGIKATFAKDSNVKKFVYTVEEKDAV